MSQRQILVTAALPYANGHIHLGHLVEYIQTDIWVRFQKLMGHRCIYICADDTHGTAIMLRARQEGRSEEAVIADMREHHVRDFGQFDISFDNYGSTHSPANRELCERIWRELRQGDLIVERDVTQLYDPEAGTFLADRFVKGTCPVCKSPDQYGDNCDKCNSTYSPTDLIDPRSAISGATPVLRSSSHSFFQLERLHGFLEEWTQSGEHLQPETANKLRTDFLNKPLRDWDISRPAPYFGFEIPDRPGHYWYVWFDAPVGYMASTQEWCQRQGEKFDDWWRSPRTEIHHFIGKDITYFHTLFWPAMLKCSGFSLPQFVHIHGFLTVNGEKMSKSKGTFVRAATYAEHLDTSHLRYYYASKLTQRVDDLDLNLDEFVSKVNADLVGKVVNLASRTAKFVGGGQLDAQYPDDSGLFAQAAEEGRAIAAAYDACDYNQAMRQIMVLADRANKYIEDREPWKLRKDPAQTDELRRVCTVALNLFRQIAIYLTPVLPRLAQQTGELLNRPIERWEESQRPLLGTPVGQYAHMLTRVERTQVEAMIAASREEAPSGTPAAAPPADGPEALLAEPLGETISFDDFAKVDLRVARVLTAEKVAESNKLLKLTLTLGGDQRRTVFAGIQGVYEPEQLVNRLVVCAANLAPRKMRFGTSEGMVVAAGPGGKDIYLLSPDSGAVPGQRVH